MELSLGGGDLVNRTVSGRSRVSGTDFDWPSSLTFNLLNFIIST